MKITLRTILLWAGALLAIVAFFLALGAGIIYKGDATTIEMKGLIFGNQKTITTITLLGKTNVTETVVEAKDAIHSTLSQIGVIMVLVAGVAAALLGLLKTKDIKVIALIVAFVILVGTVFVLLIKLGYVEAVIEDGTKNLTNEDVIKAFRDTTEDLYEDYQNNGLTIVSAILGFVSAGLVGVSGFIQQKKSKKR